MVLWQNPDITAAGPASWTWARRGDCLLQPPVRDYLNIIHVHSDTNQHPSPASCCLLVPGTAHCPGLVRHGNQFPVPVGFHILVPMAIPPLPISFPGTCQVAQGSTSSCGSLRYGLSCEFFPRWTQNHQPGFWGSPFSLPLPCTWGGFAVLWPPWGRGVLTVG